MELNELFVGRVAMEERERQLRIQRAWSMYFGQHKKQLRASKDGVDDNVTLNFARVIADKAAMALFSEMFSFEFDSDSKERTPAEAFCDATLARAGGVGFWQKVALNGAVAGHAFVRIAPQPGGYPRLINVSPEYVALRVDPLDVERLLRVVIEFPAVGKDGGGASYREIMTFDEAAANWLIETFEAKGFLGWRKLDEVRWPFPWPPLVHCQNLPSPNELYGVADLEPDVLNLNDAINFTMSNIHRILRFHAHPKTWGTGFTSTDLNASPDATLILPPGATLQNLEMQADLAAAMQHYRNLREALHELAAIPEIALGKLDGVGSLSGTALRILYQPLLDRLAQKRTLYGAMIRQLLARVAALGGFAVDEEAVVVTWPEFAVTPWAERLQAAALAQQLGVSRDTVLRELGYDPDVEAIKRQAEAQTAADLFAVAFSSGDVEAVSRA